MNKPRFLFGDIVVVNKSDIGVICKTWEKSNGKYEYEVYVRLANSIITFAEEDIDRYRVRHKYLSEEEMETIVAELARKGIEKPKGFSALEQFIKDRLSECE